MYYVMLDLSLLSTIIMTFIRSSFSGPAKSQDDAVDVYVMDGGN